MIEAGKKPVITLYQGLLHGDLPSEIVIGITEVLEKLAKEALKPIAFSEEEPNLKPQERR